MKILSVKQPWALLIVNGIKDIENRTWKTNYDRKARIPTPFKEWDESVKLIQILHKYLEFCK